uniref:hypothetical protein n=1 Tax=Salmonella sp. TaxID=599 RepID=UPI001CDA3574|nr:hypothetical protein [Salmonella sp.]
MVANVSVSPTSLDVDEGETIAANTSKAQKKNKAEAAENTPPSRGVQEKRMANKQLSRHLTQQTNLHC